MLKIAMSRLAKDFAPLPFLAAWSLFICILFDKMQAQNINSFLVSTFEEGIGLRTTLSLLVLTMFVAGLAWIIRPEGNGIVSRIFLAPVEAARSTCITTIAFGVGLIIAAAITHGSAMVKQLLPSLGTLFSLWFLLNCVECLISEASNNREKQYRLYCIFAGVIFVLCSFYTVYRLYVDIKAGTIA